MFEEMSNKIRLNQKTTLMYLKLKRKPQLQLKRQAHTITIKKQPHTITIKKTTTQR